MRLKDPIMRVADDRCAGHLVEMSMGPGGETRHGDASYREKETSTPSALVRVQVADVR